MKRCEINKRIRQVLGLTIQELADRVETSKQTIGNYENNKNYNRVLERVIELELDLAIGKNDNESIKKCCEILREERSRV